MDGKTNVEMSRKKAVGYDRCKRTGFGRDGDRDCWHCWDPVEILV